MAENSTIEWTHHTFSAWVGCTKVSPGCDNCYAEGWAKRTGQSHLWSGERRRTRPANWKKVLAWNRMALEAGERHRVFCSSLADVFDNQVPEEWRRDLFDLIVWTPNLDWLLLTKRPQNIMRMLPDWWCAGSNMGPPPNVWLGTTAENQDELERRWPVLAAAPAVVRFLSCEPLIGALDLRRLARPGDITLDALTGYHSAERVVDGGWLAAQAALAQLPRLPDPLPPVDWIICGGESGGKARMMDLGWARKLRDDCAATHTPFFFKQTTKKGEIPSDLLVRQYPQPAQPHAALERICEQ